MSSQISQNEIYAHKFDPKNKKYKHTISDENFQQAKEVKLVIMCQHKI